MKQKRFTAALTAVCAIAFLAFSVLAELVGISAAWAAASFAVAMVLAVYPALARKIFGNETATPVTSGPAAFCFCLSLILAMLSYGETLRMKSGIFGPDLLITSDDQSVNLLLYYILGAVCIVATAVVAYVRTLRYSPALATKSV